jgi:hypothetical protein
LAAEKRKKMNTLHLNKPLSVRQIAAAFKKLSRKDKDKLIDLIWDHVYDVPKNIHEGLAEYLEHVRNNPGQLISIEEAVKRWGSKS